MVNTVEYLHQLTTVRSRLYFIGQVQLRNAVRAEIVQQDSDFCVAMVSHPDPVQQVNRNGDNVPGVALWCTQFFR